MYGSSDLQPWVIQRMVLCVSKSLYIHSSVLSESLLKTGSSNFVIYSIALFAEIVAVLMSLRVLKTVSFMPDGWTNVMIYSIS